ncbi:MAG: DNA mismatch repair protein MutS [Spirochaetales bacterium]|uniref:DNA mismatch repair protein MutS n=1 Tax=Candidatus Thalassospirochaeta sargassi TaxID=3119039 RepID=A0AAJ1MJL5_9SPIO|nr:DNA mismatch repair protein MutS [Spirochaetales bacterium]
MPADTPMMRQYKRIKQSHTDSILFFRLGDFYEMFLSDAKEASSILNLTLTKRHNIPMCGIPYHAAHSYIARLLKAGKKIAICEQTKMPEGGKGIAEREVVEIITPGTVVDEDFLDKDRNNYLFAAGICRDSLSIAYTDLSTGEFFASAFDASKAADILKRELRRLSPGELLIQQSLLEENDEVARILDERTELLVNRYPDWAFDIENSSMLLKKQFNLMTLKGFGINDYDPAVFSCGIILEYIADTSKSLLPHIRRLRIIRDEDFLLLDESSLKNLEITGNLQDGGKRYSLLEVIDQTRTAMGSRRLKNWLLHPLLKKSEIITRQTRVEFLYHNQILLSGINEKLSSILDIERLSSRIGMDKAHAKNLLAVRNSLRSAFELNELLVEWESNDGPGTLSNEVATGAAEILKLLDDSIDEDPSTLLTEGRMIKSGYSMELDELKNLKQHSKEILTAYLEQEKEESGITSLKIRYNRIIGYFIEVTKTNLDLVPEHFIRRQSLVAAERFTTDRLIELETNLNSASDKAVELEKQLFLEVRDQIKIRIEILLSLAAYISEIDCLASLASAATKYGWVKPTISDGSECRIINGRHPVVEANIPSGEFIPNNLSLNDAETSFALITGPNMAGKSTYLRQNALIILMAQAGSFIPADSAVIGIVDRIFCRVGASDNLARGESTFMVEMNETANILNSASSRSLVIMDEVGRGTGTNDGLSIAWAVSEYLLNQIKAKTLFATHYHELTTLEHKRLKNLSLDVRENHGEIVFLKRIKDGPADASYGIHVASLAGLPEEVIARAEEIQSSLEEREQKAGSRTPDSGESKTVELFAAEEMLKSEVMGIDLNNCTPLQALNTIAAWKEKYKN